MKRFIQFVTYNNAVPIVLGVLFLSSGLVFAANEEAREFVANSFFEAQEAVISIDNTYIASKNLDAYSPKVAIQNVTEDSEFYYVEYTFTTIGLEDSVWQDVAESRVMQVAKTALGEYTDLGVYVTEQLKQIVARELTYLREVQSIERQQVSSKVVATAYSGLVGQFINSTTQELPGYTPQVSEPTTDNPDPVAVAKAEKSDVVTPPPPRASSNSGEEDQPSGLVVTPLGANPARIPLGASYNDLGVVVTTQEGVTLDLSVQMKVNGEDVSSVSIDTTEVKDWSVLYSVSDQQRGSGSVERVVIVFDPNATEEPEVDTATSTEDASNDSATSTTATSTSPVEENSENQSTSGSEESEEVPVTPGESEAAAESSATTTEAVESTTSTSTPEE